MLQYLKTLRSYCSNSKDHALKSLIARIEDKAILDKNARISIIDTYIEKAGDYETLTLLNSLKDKLTMLDS